ncbi:MAG: Mur ligase family protein [Pseudomonadota bacterium]
MSTPSQWLQRGVLRHLRHSRWVAYLWRSLMFRTTVIAITGSVGKTTCRELLTRILAEQGPTYATRNNENDRFGVTGVLLRIRPWHKYAVIELGASGPGTMTELASLVRPDVAIVTAVARTHTNNYPGGIDEIAAEKAELLRYTRRRGTAVLNGDDPRVLAHRILAPTTSVLFGHDSHNHTIAEVVGASWPQRLSMRITHSRGVPCAPTTIQTQLVGQHWFNSVLGAFTAATTLGISPADAALAISRVPPFRARMQPLALPNGATMIRDKNASVDVLQAMFKVAATAQARRRLLVLGDSNDMTGFKHSRKRLARQGQMVAEEPFDLVIFVGPAAYRAAKAAIDAGRDPDNTHAVEDIVGADALLKQHIQKGDLVFVKGKVTQHLCRLAFMQYGPIGCSVKSCPIRSECELCPQLQASAPLTPAPLIQATKVCAE